jgi:serine/threonine protein phosphatase PrpC
VVCLVVDAKIYVANLGDSRALMFNNQEYCELTKDHKPSDNH